MGCGQSRLEPDEEAQCGSSPSAPHGMRWMHDLRRRKDRASRKRALVSAAETLPSESAKAGESNHSPPQVQDAEGKRRKSGLGPAIGKDRKSEKGDDGEEEFPGSPSFRFYFEGPWEDKESTGKISEQQHQGH